MTLGARAAGAAGAGSAAIRGGATADAAAPSVAPVSCRWLGRIAFAAALELQEEIVREHARHGDTLLLLEHDPVYTTGRGGRVESLGSLSEQIASEGVDAAQVPLFRIGRGGDATYHGPGQLVGYALVDLRARGGDLHRFLRGLEAGVLATLEALGVSALRWPGRTGAWVADGGASLVEIGERDLYLGRVRKIASIGIGVRRGISLHGFAINVSLDLAPFAAIVPCGLAGVRMTSVEIETRRPAPPLREVAAIAADRVAGALGAEGALAPEEAP